MTPITLRTLSLVLTGALLMTLASSTEAATNYVNAKAKGGDGQNSTFHANAAVGDGGASSCSHASGEGR